METKRITRHNHRSNSEHRHAKRKPRAVHFFKTNDKKGFRIPAALRKIDTLTAIHRNLSGYGISKSDLMDYAHAIAVMKHWIKFPLIRKDDYKTAITVGKNLMRALHSQFDITHIDYSDRCIHFSDPIDSPECGFLPIKYVTHGTTEEIRFNLACLKALDSLGYQTTRNEFFKYQDQMWEEMESQDSLRTKGHHDRAFRQATEEKVIHIVNYAEKHGDYKDLFIFKDTDPIKHSYGLLLHILMETNFYMPNFAQPFMEGESETGIGYYDVHCFCYNYSTRFHRFYNRVIDSIYQSMGCLDQLRYRVALDKEKLYVTAYPFLYEILDILPDYNFKTGTFFGKDRPHIAADEERCLKLTVRLDDLFFEGRNIRRSCIGKSEWINKGEATTADKALIESYEHYENFVTTARGLVAKGTDLYQSKRQEPEADVAKPLDDTATDIHEYDEEGEE